MQKLIKLPLWRRLRGLILLSICTCAPTMAQDVVVVASPNVAEIQKSDIQATETQATDIQAPEDSIHLSLPLLNELGQMPYTSHYLGIYPMFDYSMSNWELHKGLNVNLGASVFATFGKHASNSVGFTQNVAMQYAIPITDKLSVSLGGFMSNIYWQNNSNKNAAINAVLSYRFNDKWEAYVYAQKSLTNNINMALPLYDMQALGDRIGAAVKYNVSPSFSVQVSVERRDEPKYMWPMQRAVPQERK